MQETGKILFYNANEGVGIIITGRKEKYEFEVVDWDDYDTLPDRGMEVSFEPDGDFATHIMVVDTAAAAKPKEPAKQEEAVFSPDAPMLTLIHLNIDPGEAIREYFDRIERNIQEHTQYKTATGRLDFLRIRRFLFTTYNNLTELDVNFITPELKVMRDDLLQMSQVYDDYKIKATYPDVAFDKVFLSRQPDYVYLRQDAEYSFNELKGLHTSEQMLTERVEDKEVILNRTLRSSTQFPRLEGEYKELKKKHVDTIHLIASLNERYKEASRLMGEFEQEHQHTFFERFTEASRKYRKQIIYILDAQSFMFDELLWHQAKKSKVIKRFFEEAHIKGNYCAKTYLKYYLNTLDQQIISVEQQELFELYEYLESLEHDKIMILVHDFDDALRLKYLLAKIDSSLSIEAFVDERKALAWAQKKEPSIMLIEDQLQNLSFGQFMTTCKKRVSFQPIILLLSNLGPESFDEEGIEMVIRKGFSDKEMRKAIEEVLQKDENG
ncbi:MAG: hypothetical protein U9Q62_04880 [Campylobacterota bacterium]|nr:hypothetical protein [Campylobacterota bacterium]